jgi:mRNA interferase HicA
MKLSRRGKFQALKKLKNWNWCEATRFDFKVGIRWGVLVRHGGKHDIYHNPKTGATQPVPRHKEINELLARKKLRDLTKE